MDYVLHILILVGLYSVLGMSLNLLAGYSGLLSICHAAFYGIGAYATALLALKLQLPWLITVPLSAACTGLIAWAIGKIALRFRDDLFVIVTFSFQVIIYGLMLNWTSLTQGPMGLPGIPQPSVVGWQLSDNWEFLTLTTVFATCAFVILWRLVKSPYGRCLKGIREDEIYVASVGKSTAEFKTSAFVVAAVLAGLCGSFYAGYISFIDPSSFTVSESIFILAIVIVGGAGSLWGPIVGAVVLVLLPELLRFLELPSSVAANIRQILYGSLLVAFMLWRPQGFLGEYAFQREEARE
jgi:branched-chain amino acid transport system permease protein